ncbi:putative pentatricopeptide repeat-containing protein [Tripterygium wilfordii]|uniref:Putative pentatricopeptide repeat-containing protein n=1 Tax=Tripterygium wilfordii TaxID=458696 RepID=A0A7J7DRM1_TRIWF|nr:putative pentatricopeptide repeat-containing protein At3g28640 [Tripterygium wilfordii]KAF5749028.1 putative pentatricopeptide repeat-containing protein [Tripterygium wilfordii]
MLSDVDVVPDNHTFHFAILGCVNSNWMILGRQIHNWVIKNGGVTSDSHVQTSLARLYSVCGVMSDAKKVFGEIPLPDMVQWNVLMNGYIRCDSATESSRVFQVMLVQGTEPDEYCCTTALTACAQSGALWQDKWIHEYMRRQGFDLDVFSGTDLVDMYAKCGCIDLAVEVFEGMSKRNVFSWAAMIGGFAVHGYARKALDALEKMQVEDRIKPDGVVILGVLMACTHAGLQVEGQSLLENMEARYGIVPQHEHYSCVVDLLCRKGQLDEALHLIRRMPMKPLASVWGALLSSCQTHKDVKLAILAAKELLELDNTGVAKEDVAYVQLSNVYFSAEKNEDACRIRKMIDDRGLKKTPGCSMIEVDGMASEFLSGDVSHPLIPHIHAMLELLFFHSIH